MFVYTDIKPLLFGTNMRSLLLIFFFSLLSTFQVDASEKIILEGRLLNEFKQPIAQGIIKIAGNSVTSDDKGRYSIALDEQTIYQLSFAKQGYFNSIQTFSHYELFSQSKDQQQPIIADITLVQKTNKRVMLAFGGDVMMGRRFYKPYFGDDILIHRESKLIDSKAVVENIKPYMSIADYAAVNLETQVADALPGERAPKSVIFYSEPEVLDALSWAGIDYVSLGNNHTFDYMTSGLVSTLAFLNQSKLGFSGAGINESHALKAHHHVIKNTEFSMLGYVGWEGSANPTQTANHEHGGAAYGSMKNIIESVKSEVAKDKVTIVQYHGSQEYANNPTGVTEQRLKSALDTGAALAIAHHPHVTQGLELYEGKLIAYSMGNFIFDQNFSATQHSFILYVWLDEGKFHRAEIVPLYVKGYKPTPATGMHRYTVMKRLTELSKTRNTTISQSGGHGVITAQNKLIADEKSNKNTTTDLLFTQGSKVASLYHLPWQHQITKVKLPAKELKYRFGTNLVNGSDFESFLTFDSPERGWLFDRDITNINNYGASGNKSLGITLKEGQPSTFGMQSFKRVFSASRPITVKANFKSSEAVTLSFYWQGRKNRQKLFDAFKNSPKNLIKTVELNGANQWQAVEVDFNSPRIGYKSYRVLVELTLKESTSSQIDIDDFAVVEWQSSFTGNVQPQYFTIDSSQGSYIGLNKATVKKVQLSY